MLVTASKDTDVGPRPGSGLENVGHIGKGFGIAIGVIAVVPIVVFAVVATRHTPPRSDVRSDHVSPGMHRVLDRLDTPAMVTNDLGEVLALAGRRDGSP